MNSEEISEEIYLKYLNDLAVILMDTNSQAIVIEKISNFILSPNEVTRKFGISILKKCSV